MQKNTDEQKKEIESEVNNVCFIITPIGDDDSDIRRHANGVIESVIKPLLENTPHNFKVVVAHEINDAGSIPNQVFDNVVNAKLVITNVTGLNANVMYELGVRHALRKPVITIGEKGTRLPFDITTQRTIFYTNDMLGVNELKDSLGRMLDTIDYAKEIEDNPVMNALRQSEIFKNVDEDDKEQRLLSEVYYLLNRINKKVDMDVYRHQNLKHFDISIIKLNDEGKIININEEDAKKVIDILDFLPNKVVHFSIKPSIIIFTLRNVHGLSKSELIEMLNDKFHEIKSNYRALIEEDF